MVGLKPTLSLENLLPRLQVAKHAVVDHVATRAELLSIYHSIYLSIYLIHLLAARRTMGMQQLKLARARDALLAIANLFPYGGSRCLHVLKVHRA